MQFGVYSALGLADQTSTPPFFNPKLETVRSALR
jgi:hypothetical protein